MKFEISVRNRELDKSQTAELSKLGFTFDEHPADKRCVDQSPVYSVSGDVDKEISSLEELIQLSSDFGTLALSGNSIELLRYRDEVL